MRDLGGTAGPCHIWSHHTRAVCLRARAPAGSPLLPRQKQPSLSLERLEVLEWFESWVHLPEV